MDAWFLRGLFDSVYVVALAAWVGSMLFFTFGVAPVVSEVLEGDAGGRFVRTIVARYYLWGTVCGAVALPAAMGVPLSFPEYRAPGVGLQALGILAGTLIMLYAGNSLTPAINAARAAGPSGQAQLARLLRRSVTLNGVALGIGIGLLIAFANRPTPRSSGIVEPTPQERARREAEAWRAKVDREKAAPANRPSR